MFAAVITILVTFALSGPTLKKLHINEGHS
jgi:hypothetical protein